MAKYTPPRRTPQNISPNNFDKDKFEIWKNRARSHLVKQEHDRNFFSHLPVDDEEDADQILHESGATSFNMQEVNGGDTIDSDDDELRDILEESEDSILHDNNNGNGEVELSNEHDPPSRFHRHNPANFRSAIGKKVEQSKYIVEGSPNNSKDDAVKSLITSEMTAEQQPSSSLLEALLPDPGQRPPVSFTFYHSLGHCRV